MKEESVDRKENWRVRFVLSAVEPAQFPQASWPEVAFAGRSNVGKSSLLNYLIGQRRMAKVSSTPGRTRQINFFAVNDAFHLVDLPGYGFAKVSKEERASWRKLIDAYLRRREQLAAVVVLLDVRRLPDDNDLWLVDQLRAMGAPAVIAITKSDKLPLQQRRKQVLSISRALHLQPTDCHVTSAEKGWGRDSLWNALACFLPIEDSDRAGG